jgi:16S rRNA (uracil1498-N3)-methyltransferase
VARRRFFVEQVCGETAELYGEDARHLARVLRAEPGQKYEISDSRSVWLAEIAEARGDRVVFRILEPVATPEIPVRITLFPALVKFDRFEWIIEKASELGVERIVPIAGARSEKGLFEASQKRMERWKRIAHEAGQQARRLRAPEILPAVSFETALTHSAEFRYFLEESAAPPFFGCLPAMRAPSAQVALLIGPEGGWIDAERHAAAHAGWMAVSLGPLVLRSETAATAALAIVLNFWCAPGGTLQYK